MNLINEVMRKFFKWFTSITSAYWRSVQRQYYILWKVVKYGSVDFLILRKIHLSLWIFIKMSDIYCYRHVHGFLSRCRISIVTVMCTDFSNIFQKYFTSVYIENISAEAGALRCSVKKVFLKISQISQENTCARVSF